MKTLMHETVVTLDGTAKAEIREYNDGGDTTWTYTVFIPTVKGTVLLSGHGRSHKDAQRCAAADYGDWAFDNGAGPVWDA